MSMNLKTEGIADPVVKDNFEKMNISLNLLDLLKGGFKFYEMITRTPVTNKKFKHSLGYKPTDVIQTSITGAGSLTWNYSRFTIDYLDYTTTGACTVRFFVGRYTEGESL